MNYQDISQSDFSLDYTSGFSGAAFDIVEPVSYTHLTLPTTPYV